jgi:hypothetical protein
MNESCAGSGGTTRGAGGGVGDGRVGADIAVGAGDVGTFVGIGDIGPPAGEDGMLYGAAGSIVYEDGEGILDGAGDVGIFVGIGEGALTICGAAIGSSFCPLFDSLPLPLPLLEWA